MNEIGMKKMFANRYMEANSGALSETVFAPNLMKKGVRKFVNLAQNIATSTQGSEKLISAVITDILQYGDIEDVAYCVIEYILSGLTVDPENEEKQRFKNIRMATGNKLREKLLDLKDTEENTVVAVQFMEIGLQALEDYVDTEHVKGDKMHIKYCIKPEFRKKIIAELKQKSESGFYALPMTEPPVDWDVTEEDGKIIVKGGYREIQTALIRGGKTDMPKDSFNADFMLYNKKPLQALNIIQAIPFRVNKEVFEAVKADIKNDIIKPIPTKFVKEWKKQLFEFFKAYPNKESRIEAGVNIPETPIEVLEYDAAISRYKTEKGRMISAKLSLKIAEMFLNVPAIYFPHNFDYRGRIYPIPSAFSPQGDDIAKGMLEFANETELSIHGLDACYAYLASTFGYDKLPFDERLKLGYNLMDNNADYHKAEEPYVFLQVKKFLQNVEDLGEFKSHLALAIDGSCNGLQHMSAITMDADGGSYVNVGPAAPRQDIYSEIASQAANLVAEDIKVGKYENDEDASLLKWIYNILTGDKARKIAKRPVMINPYGGTFLGFKEYVLQALQEFYPEYSTNKNAARITQYISNAMKNKLVGGTAYQGWVRTTFAGIARLGVAPEFITPDGFVVRNYSYEVESKTKHMSSIVKRNGKTIIRTMVRTNELNSRKIGTRAQPNIIHSLDATHLRMVAIEANKAGIENLWFIHDSFATDPNNYALLNQITRKEFIKLYTPGKQNHPVNQIIKHLTGLLEQCDKQYEFSEFPSFKGVNKLKLNKLTENEFFFM